MKPNKTLLTWLACAGVVAAAIFGAQAPASANLGGCESVSGVQLTPITNQCGDGYGGYSIDHIYAYNTSGERYFSINWQSQNNGTATAYATLWCIGTDGSKVKAFYSARDGVLANVVPRNVSCGCNQTGASGQCNIGRSWCGTGSNASACGNHSYD